jgi:iron(III) transport system permease protein
VPGPRPPAFLLVAGIVLAGAAALPLVYLAVVVAGSAGDALDTLWRERTAELVLRSFGLAVTVTAAATATAIPLAWLTVRTDLPGRRLWTVAVALPLVIPSYIGAYAFLSALGPEGLLSDLLDPLGIGQLPSITGFPGAWLTLTLFTYPFVLLPLRASLRGLDPQLEEAALGMGRRPAEVFRTVVLPQLVPAIGAGGLLVALYVLSDFGAVSIMRFDSFTTSIYTHYRASFDRIGAASLSALLVVLMLMLLWLEARTRRHRTLHRSSPGAPRPPRMIALGRWRWPALGLCAAVTLFALVVPVAVLIYWSVQSVAGDVAWGEIAAAAGNSLLASGLAAFVAALCAIPIAVLAVRFTGPFAASVERLSYTGHALPGIAVALALVFFGTRVAIDLYQTLAMLVFAFVVLFLPLAVGITRASMLQVSPRVEEAARSLGRTPFGVLRSVTAPLIAPGVLAGAALVFLTAVKELPATLILAPIGFETLATEIWNATSVGFFERGAIPSLVLLALSAGPLYLLTARE